MQNNHHSLFNEHIRYVNNYAPKPFNMDILQYVKCMQEMFELGNYLFTPIRNNDDYRDAD